MNVLWLFAHPEGRSLGAALKDDGVRTLTGLGHRVCVRDLYAMKWDPVVGADDFDHPAGQRLLVSEASQRAYGQATLRADIRAEQELVVWADTLIVQFPLWWHGMPAILKGWFDRVFVNGFAYGVTDSDTGRRRRYGDGGLSGRRAMVVTTIGGREASFGPRGIHGDLADLLFPVHHGIFWYSGVAVLPPLPVFAADRAAPGDFDAAAARLRERLAAIAETEPIPFRPENGGDYDADLVLRPHVAPGQYGMGVHYA